MIEKFLNAKHWQIFLIGFGIPFSIQTVFMTFSKNDPEIMMKIAPYIIIIFFLGLFGWLFSISIGLQRKIPAGIKMKIRKFKIFLLIPLIYMPFAFGLMDLLVNNIPQENSAMIGGVFAIIFPLHFLSIFGVLYSFYFTAKTLKSAELQKEVTFFDFAGEFFMLLFFPIGVWVIQPRINDLIK